MNCYQCRHAETGGDKVKCARGGLRDLAKEEVLKGCRNISCFHKSEEDRFPTQIAPVSNGSHVTLYALCNDETMWKISNIKNEWTRIPGIPQRGEKPEEK